MEQAIVFGVSALILAGAAGLAHVTARKLRQFGVARPIGVGVAGLLPISLIVLALYVWERIERARYEASGSDEGYMGPMLFLLYGYPLVILIVIACFVAALRADRRA